MKSVFFTLLVFVFFNALQAQNQQFKDLHPDSVMRQDPRMSRSEYEPGEILIRFEDDLDVSIEKSQGKLLLKNNELSKIFNSMELEYVEQLFPNSPKKLTKSFITTFSGKKIEVPNLHNIFLVKTSTDPFEQSRFMESLNASKHVVYAEPNYIQAITKTEPLSQVMNEAEMLEWLGKNNQQNNKNNTVFELNDPLYSDQWYIPAVGADLVWDSINGKDTTQVIAILDTGVDWAHPDLQNKIWINQQEIPDNGIDDDGNGKVDDIRGWDWINHDNNPMDDNSHGTHVAGIAAAEANNEIGISGVSHGAKIMPLKVLQSSGFGNSATIAQGIHYAANNGATVINMSFGSYARSLIMEDALVNAYAIAILVAAAGNDGIKIGPCDDGCAPAFPAALSYVLGVEAPEASWSNWDQDGPTLSQYSDLLNYELKAPGTIILSTVPNGNYRVFQGTSMAAPILSGAWALYRSLRANDSMEEMWVKLIQNTDTYVNIFDALNKIPTPEVRTISQTTIDTMPDCDNDGRVDAGETIKLWFSARNTGGQCDSTWFKIRFYEFEDTSTAQIIKATSYIGSMSPYAFKTSQYDPMLIKINENVANDREIIFDLLTWHQGCNDTLVQTVILNIENGEELRGVIMDTLVLTSNKLWLVNQSFKIGNTGVLYMEPGSKLIAKNSFVVDGKLIGNGTSEENIFIDGIALRGSGSLSLSHSNLTLSEDFANSWSSILNISCNFNNCKLNMNASSCFQNYSHNIELIINNCIINLSGTRGISHYPLVNINNSNIWCNNSYEFFSNVSLITNENNNFLTIKPVEKFDPNLFQQCNVFEREPSIGDLSGYYYTLPGNIYFGTVDSLKIAKIIYDFYDDPSLAEINYMQNLIAQPFASNHAITWKVLVNSADAQDEYVEPVGVGPQRFDVYFNREMDTAFTPQLTFGVRYPYTQQIVADSARWDSTHKIFTAYKNIQIYTGDGINRIRVAKARDLEGWEIPVEDMRFEFLINAAGSASIDFTATPGIGKVDLEWHEPDDLPTLLGYNMYRFHHLTDTTFSDTTLVNSNLINDTLFTDFNVDPLEKYYYMYKIVRTDFTESDYSKVVNATVLTASPGDANGDQTVNVLDITSIVGHILNQNPQPFLSEAADVNEDGAINLLDIIGVVNIIMGNNKQPQFSVPAYAYLEPESIQFKSDGSLSGFQFQLISPGIEELELKSLLPGYEFIKLIRGDTLTGLIFSMDNKAIPEGKIKLFEVTNHPGTLSWGELFAGNLNGDYVPVYKDATQLPEDYRYNFTLYPNPSQGAITLELYVPETSDLEITVFNTLGQSIYQRSEKDLTKGNHKLQLNITGQHAQGLHYVNITYQPKSKTGSMSYRKVQKIILH